MLLAKVQQVAAGVIGHSRLSAAEDADFCRSALGGVDQGVASLPGARDLPMQASCAKFLFDLDPMESIVQTTRIVTRDCIDVFTKLREK